MVLSLILWLAVLIGRFINSCTPAGQAHDLQQHLKLPVLSPAHILPFSWSYSVKSTAHILDMKMCQNSLNLLCILEND